MIRHANTLATGQLPILTELYDEIHRQDWSLPAQTSIPELGIAMGTHPGLKRGRNEDRIAVARVSALNGEIYTAAILCDGVGGSEAGDRAAEFAIASVLNQLAILAQRPPLKDLVKTLIRKADDDVRSAVSSRGSTTIVMLLGTSVGFLVCASVGDSRAYSWMRAGRQVNQITIDDTIENELKNIPGNHAALLKERGLQGRLSQAIGEDGRPSTDLRIQTYTREKFTGGAMLGTDGLWRVAKDFPTVSSIALNAGDLVRRVLNLANWVGGVDNSSVIAIEDISLFCKPQTTTTGDNSTETLSIQIWTPQQKIKFSYQFWSQNKSEIQKTRTKRKTSKTKAEKSIPDNQQLSLGSEPDELNTSKPKLEITLGVDKN